MFRIIFQSLAAQNMALFSIKNDARIIFLIFTSFELSVPPPLYLRVHIHPRGNPCQGAWGCVALVQHLADQPPLGAATTFVPNAEGYMSPAADLVFDDAKWLPPTGPSGWGVGSVGENDGVEGGKYK